MPGEWEREDDRRPADGVGQVDWDAELQRLLEEHTRGTGAPVPVEPPAGRADLVEPAWPEGDDWEPSSGRHNRPRVVRMAAVVVAAALILGLVGGTVGIFFHPGPLPPLATLVTSVTPASTPGTEQVAFAVENDADSPVTPTCTVEVLRSGAVIGTTTTKAASALAPGAEDTGKVDVAVAGPAFDGQPSDARVACSTP